MLHPHNRTTSHDDAVTCPLSTAYLSSALVADSPLHSGPHARRTAHGRLHRASGIPDFGPAQPSHRSRNASQARRRTRRGRFGAAGTPRLTPGQAHVHALCTDGVVIVRADGDDLPCSSATLERAVDDLPLVGDRMVLMTCPEWAFDPADAASSDPFDALRASAWTGAAASDDVLQTVGAVYVTLDAHVPADTPHRWDVLAEAVDHHLREAVIANGNDVDPAAPLLPPLAAFLLIRLTAIAVGECRGITERTAALRRMIATGRVRAMIDPR